MEETLIIQGFQMEEETYEEFMTIIEQKQIYRRNNSRLIHARVVNESLHGLIHDLQLRLTYS